MGLDYGMMTAGVCVLAGALILRQFARPCPWPGHLAALLAIFAIVLVSAISPVAVVAEPAPALGLSAAVLPAIGAAVWFYVRALVEPGFTWRRKDLVHLLPALVIYLCYLPFQMLSFEQRSLLEQNERAFADPQLALVIGLMLLAWVTWLCILVGYGLSTLHRLYLHRRLMKQHYSDLSGKSLWWMNGLIAAFVACVAVVMVASLLPATRFADLGVDHLWGPAVFSVTLGFAAFALTQDRAVPEWSELAPDTPKVATIGDLTGASRVAPKYEKSALTDVDMDRIAAKLDQSMARDQLWQNPNLSLRDLTTATGVSQNNLSQTLNAHLGASFFEFVNAWRVKAACRALRTSDATILSIAEACGFNSKSTFNAAFKRVMGQTPRQYRAGTSSSDLKTAQ